MYNISEKQLSRIIFILKIVVISGAYWIIASKVFDQKNLLAFFDLDVFSRPHVYILGWFLLILGLSLLNWVIECLKWKNLVDSLRIISFFEAGKQSLASLTVSLMTPNRIGEYGAKAIFYSKKERSNILLFNFLGNSFQMLATILFGMLGLSVLGKNLIHFQYESSLIFGMVLIFVLFVLTSYLLRSKWLPFFERFRTQLKQVPVNTHKKNLLYSLLRFVVFSTQFYLLLLFFGVELRFFIAMPLIYSMYFISSIIPSFVVFDWMVKGSVAVALFGIYGVNELVIISITSSMWILNFALPSIIGSFFVLSFNKKSLAIKEDLAAR